jgi:hypothetical protein
MIGQKHIKLVREGDFVAEVEVERIESSEPWAPYLSLADALKLDSVRLALRNKDFSSVGKLARVYRLTPLATAV